MNPFSSTSSRQKGVTLIETLVALAVMGFVISALLVLVGQNSRFSASMRDKTMAAIAADNLMIKAMVLQEALETGESEGEVSVGDYSMKFRRDVIEIGVADIRRIEITILDSQNGQILARSSSMRKPS